jgi:hypothetical protein
MTHDPDAPRPDEQRAIPWREDREAHARLAAEFDEAMRALGSQIIGPDEARLMPATVIVLGEPHDPRP